MFALGLIYLAAVLGALAFYGAHIVRILLPGLRLDAGMAIAFGLTGYMAFCGLLEVTQSATRPILLAVVVIGAAGFVISLLRERPVFGVARLDTMPGWAAIAFAVFMVSYALFLINAADWQYTWIDDTQGYLVFPERILGEGSLGRDPFNFRRIEAGLTGGGGYLYALFRAGLPLRQTRLADIGVGSSCLLLLVAGHAREYGVTSLRLATLLLVTLAVITFSQLINNTPETTGKALLFAVLRLVFILQSRPPSWRRAWALALMFFGTVGLKTTYLPEVCAILAAFYISLVGKFRLLDLAGEAAVVSVIAILLLLPWMVASHAVAGTFWYPILGTGTLSAAEVTGMTVLYQYMKDAGRLSVIAMPALLVALAAWHTPALRERRQLLAMLALSSTALMLVSQLKVTAFGYRYGQTGMAAMMLFYLPIAGQCRPTHIIRTVLPGMLTVVLVVMAISKFGNEPWFYNGWIAELAVRPAHFADGQRQDDRVKQLRAMQSVVPPGAPLFVLLSWPVLLDFRRNPIAVTDHPMQIGPAGMPAGDDPEGWSRYLTGLGFRYIAYSYGDEAMYNTRWAEADIVRFSEPDRSSPFMVEFAVGNIKMREALLAMRNLGTVIYDDGDEFVVRLNDH